MRIVAVVLLAAIPALALLWVESSEHRADVRAAQADVVVVGSGHNGLIAGAYLAKAVKDPEVRAKLTPDYDLGCKRPSFSNSYLPTFNRENVHLETTSIEAITPTGVRSKCR